MEKIKAFILDTDGTTALHLDKDQVEGRGHYEYDKISTDKPNMHVIDVVQRIVLSDMPLQPLVVTGRADKNNGKVRQDTRDWYAKHVFYLEDWELFMRKEFLTDGVTRDFRPDDVVKKEIYLNDIALYYDVQFAIDDRPKVLRMWQSLGIPTFAVGTPWLEF